MWANAAVGVLTPIAVTTECLIAGREPGPDKPAEEHRTAAAERRDHLSPMSGAIVIDVINGQEEALGFSATRTSLTVVSEHGIAVGFSLFLGEGVAVLSRPPQVNFLRLFGIALAPLVLRALDTIPILLSPLTLPFVVQIGVGPSSFSPVFTPARQTIRSQSAFSGLGQKLLFGLLNSALWTALHQSHRLAADCLE
jgi:hypothetical protein